MISCGGVSVLEGGLATEACPLCELEHCHFKQTLVRHMHFGESK